MSICLMLHGLGTPPSTIPPDEVPYWLPTEAFRRIVEFAKSRPVRFTFDDGNATDADIALPILRDAGLTAGFYIPSDRIGQPGYLSEAGIRTLRTSGMEIGSHGCAHLQWTEMPDEAIADDVTRSIDRLGSILGERIQGVAVPFGACDRRVLRVLRSLGIREVHTSFRGPAVEGAWLVRRECIKADMPLESIRDLIRKDPTSLDVALSFLRTWRHAGRATLWRA